MIKATSSLETMPEPFINEELPGKPVSLAPYATPINLVKVATKDKIIINPTCFLPPH